MNIQFTQPFSDEQMTYDFINHRYVLTESFVRSRGIDLSLILDTQAHPEPSKLPLQVLDRVSLLVYTNIYNYGYNKKDKEYLMACSPELRDILRDAMFERLNYITSSGDLSTKSGALIAQSTRIETKDLIPSVVEEMLLRASGLLHRGSYSFIKNENITY